MSGGAPPVGLSHLPEWAWRPIEQVTGAVGFPAHFGFFIIMMLLNYPLGFLFSRIPPSQFKHILASVGGLIIGWLVYGFDFIHCVIVPAVAYVIMLALPRSPVLNTVFSVGYLAYHCFVGMLFNYMGYRFDFTMALMVTCVKTSIVAFSYSDGFLVKQGKPITGNDKVDKILLTRTLDNIPGIIEYSSYVLFFPALLTGPCFGIKHYLSCMNKPSSSRPSNVPRALLQLGKASLCVIGFLLYPYVPTEFVASDAFRKLSLFNRFIYTWTTTNLYRWQFHFGFYAAEGACVAGGVGFDETTKKWDAVNNVETLQCELGRSVVLLTNYWNKNINDWLKFYIFFRVKLPNQVAAFVGGQRSAAMLVTRLVSAVWHGFYPGYYFFFVSILFTNLADDVVTRLYSVLNIEKQPFIVRALFDWLFWCFTNFTASMYGLGFILLDLKIVFAASNNIYWIGHVLAIFVIALGLFVPKPGKSKVVLAKDPKKTS